MKKLICFLGALLLVMTGCATQSQSTETSSSSTPASTEKSETVVKEDMEETKVLSGDKNGKHHRYTITSKGDKLQQLKIELLSPLPETMTANSHLSPEEMTTIINDGLKNNPEYQAVKDLEGFNIEYLVTAEKQLATTVVLDVDKIDLDKLKELSYFQDLGVGDLKDVKASTLITGLKLHGFKEETPAP